MRWLVWLITISYPFIVYAGVSHGAPKLVIALLLPLLLWRLYKSKVFINRGVWFGSVALVLLLVLHTLITDSELGLRLYPVIVNLALLLAFGLSLIFRPTIVERIARFTEPDLPDSGVRYTARVTAVWTGFFVLNTTLALYTALFSSLEIWTLYNGFVAYCMMGILAATEWLVRMRVRKRHGF